ncbi:ATP-dependent helicase HrpA [Inmirania thermothiophila]|uniref:ATP-dependent helicase HrpA n=2 Tax=Inmirania thermothiophila TaxID=1750597 RepID=A0A3N1Y1M0_9GAMM|nr:ATP-dependent helicase HrpA [Inmirania thermothiophila]
MLADAHRLRRRLRGLARRRRPPPQGVLDEIEAAIEASRARREARAAALPRPRFDDGLPVCAHREAIAAAIAAHPVVVVCGETGSGKTTQLPKICLELGRGVAGLIGHTQPRRIAARSVAARIAEELGSPPGRLVGHKVRFADHVGRDAYVKVMTDGILLAETQGDPWLLAYDTLIVDEAHERSLNIDFLLGYLRRLLERRPELKVIVTSATIDPERFARHFGGAPVVEVPGRSHPVEVRYRPLVSEDPDEEDRTLLEGILHAVDEAAACGPGDVLVFLPGEREIREAAEALRKHHPPGTEILPLYARLSAAEQQRIFRPHAGRRIVLATNVAETSLTVPGIRYVVDTGLARISRYSPRSRIQRLPVEPISRASADQRAGRCGRVGPGICFRLYAEEDYLARPRFTDPEILRTNLAAVILRMKALGLGEVEDFPFLDPPDPRQVRAGLRELEELGALDPEGRLTEIGRRLARLPVDPRIGRMLLAAAEHGALAEMVVLAAALSVQDPRERPMEAQEAADRAHAAFHDERSDFVALLRLWRAWQEARRHLSNRRQRAWCRERYLAYLRMREWQDVAGQLTGLVKDMGLRLNTEPASYEAVHCALLAGLLGQVAQLGDIGADTGVRGAQSRGAPNAAVSELGAWAAEEDGRGAGGGRLRGGAGSGEYTGARGAKLRIHPGSGLARRTPRWIVAAEIVETTRLYARTVAAVEPEWIEQAAAHLVKRSWAGPHWERRAGRVMAYERVNLWGLTLVARRKVDYGPVDPAGAREIFIREALVAGDYASRAPFWRHNQALIARLREEEARLRRRDVVVDEEALYAFYDARLPAEVRDHPTLERWRREAERADPERLFLREEDLVRDAAGAASRAEFPDHIEACGLRLALEYRFEPGHEADGVTAVVPLAALPQLDPAPFDWLVPGLLRDKVIHLMRGLPKATRRALVPVPDFADAALAALTPGARPLTEALAAELKRMTGVEIAPEAWPADLPAHLRMRFRVVDEDGRTLAAGRDLAALKAGLAQQARGVRAALGAAEGEREDLRRWDVGTLAPRRIRRGGLAIEVHPTLVDEGGRVALRLLDDAAESARRHPAGVARLALLELGALAQALRRQIPDRQRLCLLHAGLGPCEALVDDLLMGVALALFAAEPVPRDEAAFRARLEAGRGRLAAAVAEQAGWLLRALETAREVRGRLRRAPPAWRTAVADIEGQLDALLFPGMARVLPRERLRHLPRYLEAVRRRIERLEQDPRRDAERLARIAPFAERLRARREAHAARGLADPELERFRWMLEEFRVSLFAQELGTAAKVSEARLERQWEKVAP